MWPIFHQSCWVLVTIENWLQSIQCVIYVKQINIFDYSNIITTLAWSSISKGIEELYPTGTHWGWITHIWVNKLTIIGSDNGLSPGRRQAIISTNAGILLIGTFGTNFNEILSEMNTFSFKKMHLKMSSAKWRPFCLNLNMLMYSLCALVSAELS